MKTGAGPSPAREGPRLPRCVTRALAAALPSLCTGIFSILGLPRLLTLCSSSCLHPLEELIGLASLGCLCPVHWRGEACSLCAWGGHALQGTQPPKVPGRGQGCVHLKPCLQLMGCFHCLGV